jgi:hypothetical protein
MITMRWESCFNGIMIPSLFDSLIIYCSQICITVDQVPMFWELGIHYYKNCAGLLWIYSCMSIHCLVAFLSWSRFWSALLKSFQVCFSSSQFSGWKSLFRCHIAKVSRECLINDYHEYISTDSTDSTQEQNWIILAMFRWFPNNEILGNPYNIPNLLVHGQVIIY